MKLNEITDLISVRQYVYNSISNSSIDRATVNVMSGMLILIDKKIMSLLQENKFKEYIDYKDVKKAVEEVARINNIRSSLK